MTYAHQKARRARFAAQGLCTLCGDERAPGSKRCAHCRDYQAAVQRRCVGRRAATEYRWVGVNVPDDRVPDDRVPDDLGIVVLAERST